MIAELVLHPEPVAGSPMTMRWLLPEVRLPVGRLLHVPAALGELVAGGTVRTAWCEPHALRIELARGLSWREHGAQVRTAIRESLTRLDQWRTDDDRAPLLRTIVDEVLAGTVGAYIRSHGGLVDVVGVTADTVTVALGGACGHCPASVQTLHQRFETAVRQRYPDLRRVIVTTAADGRRPAALLRPRRRAG
ncbi:NifU family protein [Plantactinospora sp. WMMB334]|uniref:NifU family protein n=1 Tax=Plantactinospora sp. WMMB334 TaxID=3404119 RepID=UPI003B95CF84